jgi:hypothetical protein
MRDLNEGKSCHFSRNQEAGRDPDERNDIRSNSDRSKDEFEVVSEKLIKNGVQGRCGLQTKEEILFGSTPFVRNSSTLIAERKKRSIWSRKFFGANISSLPRRVSVF